MKIIHKHCQIKQADGKAYHIYTRPKLPTWRPRGRLDFQLIYIAAGKAHFHFGRNSEEETIVHAGHMVLYRP